MDIYSIIICIAMFVFSADGYRAINNFNTWRQHRRVMKGVAV